MPKLHEYQGKKLLRESGIPVPEGEVAATAEEVRKITGRLGKPVAIKAQVGVTGRFQAGGIRFADGAGEGEKAAEEILAKDIKGLKVEKVLVEEKLSVKGEFYASVVVNDSWRVKGPVLMFSTKGGTGIEEIAARFPEKVVSMNVDILQGVTTEDTSDLIAKLGVSPPLLKPLSKLVYGLYEVFRKYSARSVEVNPIVLTEGGKVYAADCHIVIDEASVFKHPELEIDYPRDIGRAPTKLERLAWEVERKDYRGVGYFAQMARDFGPGEGVVGFHGIGGGGAMLGADALIRRGLKLANYADTSGNPTAAKVYRIVKIIFSQPNIDGYILMGACIANQEQWHHAHALVRALREELPSRPDFPVIILIAGNKEAESLEILSEGLKGLPAKVEIYGREYVYNVDYIAERMKKLTREYRRKEES
ncbi:MAG: acetate--CoA ligase family protein [Dehalococcoidia bacterium]|nr:MAG: acetate--CoA ligase family protein [Dehalococcoidia bacterium]